MKRQSNFYLYVELDIIEKAANPKSWILGLASKPGDYFLDLSNIRSSLNTLTTFGSGQQKNAALIS